MNQFSHYPYQNFSDYNLDWLMQLVKKVNEKLSEYLENSVITFADPITWDITAQYTALTCVIDSDGTAYLSKQPVPAGVDISNTNYWLPIFNYDDNINTLRSQIAYNARNSATITQDLKTGDLVFWDGLIYQVLTDMTAGSALIIGSNIKKYTVDEKINDVITSVTNTASALAQEIQDRQNADTQLQNNIDAEAQARQDADTLLQNEIDAISSDTVLVFNTVADMLASDKEYDIGITRGYYSAEDGGGTVYRKSSTRVDILDEYNANSFFHIIGKHDLKCLGAVTDGDISGLLNAYFSIYNTLQIDDNYKITAPVVITGKSFVLDLNGHTLTTDNVTVFTFNDCHSFRLHGGTISGAYRAVKVYNCTDFKLHDLSVTDYGFFAITLESCSAFTLSLIDFTARAGANYTDGIHFYNGVSNGIVENLSGHTGDDFIAINSREREVGTTAGGIKNILFRNINTGDSYAAVRFYNQNRGDDLIDSITFENCTLSNGTVLSPVRFTNDESGVGDTQADQMRAGTVKFTACKFSNGSGLTMDSLIRFARVNIDNVIFEQCEFVNNATLSFLINAYYQNAFKNFMVDGCYFNGVTTSIPYRLQSATIEDFTFINCRHLSSSARAAVQFDGCTIEKVTISNVYANKTTEFVNAANSNIVDVTIKNLTGDFSSAISVYVSGTVSNIMVNDCSSRRDAGAVAVHLGSVPATTSTIAINNFIGNLPYNATFSSNSNIRFRSLGVAARGNTPATALNGDCYTLIDASTNAATMRLYNNGWQAL